MKKKILLITALLLFLSSSMPVQAEENQSEQLPAEKIKPVVLPPKWTDFCELGYENAVYKNSHDIFNIFSFVKSERVKKNYWAERRVSFESYLDSCNKLDDDVVFQELLTTGETGSGKENRKGCMERGL